MEEKGCFTFRGHVLHPRESHFVLLPASLKTSRRLASLAWKHWSASGQEDFRAVLLECKLTAQHLIWP